MHPRKHHGDYHTSCFLHYLDIVLRRSSNPHVFLKVRKIWLNGKLTILNWNGMKLRRLNWTLTILKGCNLLFGLKFLHIPPSISFTRTHPPTHPHPHPFHLSSSPFRTEPSSLPISLFFFFFSPQLHSYKCLPPPPFLSTFSSFPFNVSMLSPEAFHSTSHLHCCDFLSCVFTVIFYM